MAKLSRPKLRVRIASDVYPAESYLRRPAKDGRCMKKGTVPLAEEGDAGTVDRRAGAAAEHSCETFAELRRWAKWGDRVKVRLNRTGGTVWLHVNTLRNSGEKQ